MAANLRAPHTRARARLARGDDPATVLEGLARGLANKFLHHPSQALSRAAGAERERLVRAVEELFPETAGDAEGEAAAEPAEQDGEPADHGQEGRMTRAMASSAWSNAEIRSPSWRRPSAVMV